MKKKVMAIALAAATVSSMMGASMVSAATDVANNDLAYKGDLEIMHYSTSEESEGNGGSDGFRTVLAAWNDAHPDINLNENVLANAEYKTQIATLAAADNLPDVFLLQGMNTKAWAEQGLIMDLTDTIKASPYYDQYDQDYFSSLAPYLSEISEEEADNMIRTIGKFYQIMCDRREHYDK